MPIPVMQNIIQTKFFFSSLKTGRQKNHGINWNAAGLQGDDESNPLQ